MADPLILNPTLTLAGQAAAFNASNTGIELVLDSVSFGRGHYTPNGNETALVDPVGSHVPFAGGSRPTLYQLRISAAWDEDVGEVGIGEIGFWSGDVLVFVWSLANGTVASYKTDGVTYVLMADLGFAQVPANSINIVVDYDQSVALAALVAHEGAANAHPQYLLRADVAKDAGPLMGLVHSAGSAANALVLELDAPESKLPALAKFQRFQFVASSANTGPVTVNIEGLGVKAVKRGGSAGLIALEAGDIKAGSLYELNYDGAVFQLGGGGVVSGKATEANQGTAQVATLEQLIGGISDSLIATPKKLRWGFSASITPNGYIAFPYWLGGLILQWGSDITVEPSGTKAVSYTLGFPNAVFIVSVSDRASSIGTLNVIGADEGTKTGFNVWTGTNTGVGQGSLFKWFAIGN